MRVIIHLDIYPPICFNEPAREGTRREVAAAEKSSKPFSSPFASLPQSNFSTTDDKLVEVPGCTPASRSPLGRRSSLSISRRHRLPFQSKFQLIIHVAPTVKEVKKHSHREEGRGPPRNDLSTCGLENNFPAMPQKANPW